MADERGGGAVGCMLQVANGWCHVEGPYWSLTRNSTIISSSSSTTATMMMMDCPPSDYKVPYRQFLLQQDDHDHDLGDSDDDEDDQQPLLHVSLWTDHADSQNNNNKDHNMEDNSTMSTISPEARRSASAISLLFSLGIASNFTKSSLPNILDSY